MHGGSSRKTALRQALLVVNAANRVGQQMCECYDKIVILGNPGAIA